LWYYNEFWYSFVAFTPILSFEHLTVVIFVLTFLTF
jgi:hypothetical protein